MLVMMYRVTVFMIAVLLLSSSFILADYKLGLQYFKQGKYIESASEFQAEVDRAPHYDYGFYMLGMCYMMLGKNEPALSNFRKAVDLAPNKFDYHVGIAQMYVKQQKFYNAAEVLNASSALANSTAEKFQLYYLRGLAYAGQRRHAEAVIDLKNARQIKASQSVLEQLGKSCHQEGDFTCAIDAFRESLKLDANSYDANFYLSKALIEKAKTESDKSKKKPLYIEAMKYAEKVARSRPNDFENINLLASAHFGAGNLDTAVEKFKEVIRLKPNYCWAMVNLAKVLRFQQKFQEAESWLENAIQCDPQSSVAYETLGYILLKQERLEQALEIYQKIYSISPNSSIAESIDRVKTNIEIRDYNKKIADLEKLNEEEQKRYDELKKKEEYWRKKQEEGI